MRRIDRRRLGVMLAVGAGALAGATLAVAVLEAYVGVPNASVVYLTAVVATAVVAGTTGAVATALASFVLYDFLFVQPLYTFAIREPTEWLSLVLLLFVGIVVGQLVALLRARADLAVAREREARALFRVSRDLATRRTTSEVLPHVAELLKADTAMDRVWIAFGVDDATERQVADSEARPRAAVPSVYWVLRRTPGDEPAQWVRIRPMAGRQRRAQGRDLYRVRIEAGGTTLGSIWALRDPANGEPDRTETRLLAAAADQIGQVLAHDRLAGEVQAAEVARQSDALKSALLQSVSHDLRTPLATIRAAAGSLRPETGLSAAERLESAEAIDREVEYLNRLVTNLLDLSRIEAGALQPDRDVYELEDLVANTVGRLRRRLAGRPIEVDVAAPPVRVDPIFLDDALTNVVENSVKYTPDVSRLRISARELPDEPFVRLTIEDSGEGVPFDALPRLFEKFYRVPGRHRSSRSGTGIGLAVVRGLIEATGGRVAARRAELGGLAIDIDLPLAAVPAPIPVAPVP